MLVVCDVHNDIANIYLDGSSTIEVRHGEGGGGSGQALTLNSIGGAPNHNRYQCFR